MHTLPYWQGMPLGRWQPICWVGACLAAYGWVLGSYPASCWVIQVGLDSWCHHLASCCAYFLSERHRLVQNGIKNCRFHLFWCIFPTSECHNSKSVWERELRCCMCYFLKLIKDCMKFEVNRRGSSWVIGWVDMEWPYCLLCSLI